MHRSAVRTLNAALLLLAAACATPPVPEPEAEAPPPAFSQQDAKDIIAALGEIPAPGGINEQVTARIGGIDQALTIRGKDLANPVIIVVHGGPGTPEMAMSWTYQRGWEDYFTVVQWDQRGTGKTYRLNDADAVAASFSIERMRDDLIEVIDFVRERTGQEKVVILGHSWGTVIGLQAALARPDAVSVYIGSGQMVNMRRNEQVGFDATLAAARADGNAQAIADLEALAPYPGPGALTLARIGAQRNWLIHYGGTGGFRSDIDPWFRAIRLAPEYTEDDRKTYDEGGLIALEALLPELTEVDFDTVTESPVPVFMLHGRHDLNTPSQIAAEWMDRLSAPAKATYWFERSAHLSYMEEPGATLVTLVNCIRPYAVEADIETARAKIAPSCESGAAP
ncbi:MAG: alpha/beta hydrolase [Acidobacteria bacterium]|nr:alpha/beta hydrolase [Acidobacteriota bacterium]